MIAILRNRDGTTKEVNYEDLPQYGISYDDASKSYENWQMLQQPTPMGPTQWEYNVREAYKDPTKATQAEQVAAMLKQFLQEASSSSFGDLIRKYPNVEAAKGVDLYTRAKGLPTQEELGKSVTPDIINKYYPQKTTAQKNAEEKQSIANAEHTNWANKITRAIQLLGGKGGKEGTIKTGPLTGRILSLKAKYGGGTKEERELVDLLGQLTAEKLVEMGGKTLPASERQVLEPLTANVHLSTEALEDRLTRLLAEVNGIYGRLNLNSDWEIAE